MLSSIFAFQNTNFFLNKEGRGKIMLQEVLDVDIFFIFFGTFCDTYHINWNADDADFCGFFVQF